MLVPIILGSDKTTVSVATGNNEYWPVYLSIGNIHNNVRRAHRNGLVLLAFLAIPKSMTPSYSFLIISNVSDQQPTRSTRMMQNSESFGVNCSTHRLHEFFNPSSLG